MKIILHHDDLPACRAWSLVFLELLSNKHVVQIDLSKEVVDGDYFIGRFNEHSWPKVRSNYYKICDRYEGRIFPRKADLFSYDDKLVQMEWLTANGFPVPRTAYATTIEEVSHTIDFLGINYPLVCKGRSGSSSANVKMCRQIEEVPLPSLVQEFIPDNHTDLRVCVIGNKLVGFERANRQNDFRASGSGMINYIDELPMECLELAWRAHSMLGTSTMAFDFLRCNDRWLISEMSYTYRPDAVAKCRFHYEAPTFCRKEGGLFPQQLILSGIGL